jgi:hypothetical protein
MKKNKTIYWISTVAAMLTGATPAFMYFANPQFIEVFSHLGFPSYFRFELGIFKISGLLVLLIPMIPARVKEWAYVGFAITFISAMIAHANVDSLSMAMAPLIPLILLMVSYIYFHKLQPASGAK